MCTIGAVFAKEGVYTFKQCDLTSATTFFKPVVRGSSPLQYVAFTRQGRPGLWAGINQAGVGFTAADAYTNTSYAVGDADVDALFKAYEASIALFSTPREAADYLQGFYRNYNNGAGFPGPDIALHTGQGMAIFTEYTPGPNCHSSVREVVATEENYFVSTNHFRIQPDAIDYDANHSTYLRLERAQAILNAAPSRQGIVELLTDQYYGETELSICRIAGYPDEYFTQSTALMGAGPDWVTVEYQINGNPRTNPLIPFTGEFVTGRTPHLPAKLPATPPAGLLYVDQANYAVVYPEREPQFSYLYSDSATSCIIIIVVGQNARGEKTVTLAHVDSPDCVNAYFSQVLDTYFVGPAAVYAQGANPPENTTSIANANALVAALKASRPWTPAIQELNLLQGDPRQQNRGEYGIDLRTMSVSNQPVFLELLDRDPTGGVQVIFSIMRRKMTPPIQLRDAREPFEPALVDQLVKIARTDQKNPNDPTTAFTYIINLLSEEVRQTWSSTPEDEADWFSDELKQSCCFVLTYGGAEQAAATDRWGMGGYDRPMPVPLHLEAPAGSSAEDSGPTA